MEETKDYEEIKSRLNDAGKNFDEKTMNLICNFVEEFDPLFGKYIDKNELINRIINNLDEVIFDFDFKKDPYRGTYMSLLESQNGQIVGISDDGVYIDTEEGEGKPVYYVGKYENDLKSNCELLKARLSNMNQMKDLEVPKFLIDDAFNKILECLKYLNDNGIDVRNIEELIDVNIEEAIKQANTIRIKRHMMDFDTDIRKIDSVAGTINKHMKQLEHGSIENEKNILDIE